MRYTLHMSPIQFASPLMKRIAALNMLPSGGLSLNATLRDFHGDKSFAVEIATWYSYIQKLQAPT